jgi:branched-chain amino acid transport system permease protein
VAVAQTVAARTGTDERRLDPAGLLARAAVAAVLLLIVATSPLWAGSVWADRISLMAIWGIIGLSVNIIVGYAGQISLGHQAFVGIGAFTAAYVIGPHIGAGFVVSVVAAGLMGGVLAFALGLVALRVKGLYFAVVTLSFGLMAEFTIFAWRPFTGGGAGATNIPRPTGFGSNQNFAYLCLMLLAVFVFIDWRVSRTKAGRAIVAVRNNEDVAATLGVSVTQYKLLAFAVGGFFAGVAGGLLAFWNHAVYAADYDFAQQGLVWILMAVVGGLGSRAGIVVASAFFAVFPLILPSHELTIPTWLQFIGVKQVSLSYLSPLIGAVLLMLTVILYPGGIGQQLLPIRRWLAGGPFVEHRRRPSPEDIETPALATVTEGAPALSERGPEPPSRAVEPMRSRPEPEPPPPPEPERETPAVPEEPPSQQPVPVAAEPDGEQPSEPERTEELAPVPGGDGDGEEEPSEPRRRSLFGFRRRKAEP